VTCKAPSGSAPSPADPALSGAASARGGFRGGERLEQGADAQEILDGGALVLEVHHGRAHRRLGAGSGHLEAAGPAALHHRDLMVLHQPDRLAEHRPADPVPLDQLGLRADRRAHRPAGGDDVVLDRARDLGG
jgi:hypothetical protein